MSRRLFAIVPAAGVGQRAHDLHGQAGPQPKQYRLLRGEPMLLHAVRALLAEGRIDEVVVAVARGDEQARRVLAGSPRTRVSPCGGPTRAQTVTAALRELEPRAGDWVLVHDAARPGLPLQALKRLVDQCLAGGTGGLLALPVADTLKSAVLGHDGCQAVVQATINRERLWMAQTPQMFPAETLLQALERAHDEGWLVTDEASAMEGIGYRPRLVPGSARNFKVTWPEDFELMEKWL